MIVVASCVSSDEPDAVATDISTPVDDKIADTTADSTLPPVGAGSLAGAMLDTDTAEELDLIRFTGVDTTADLSELELLLTAADADPESLVIYLDDEGLYTSLPLHPVTPGHGGAVELQLVDGDSTSVLLPLQLTGLPAAPGAWDATIDAMTTELRPAPGPPAPRSPSSRRRRSSKSPTTSLPPGCSPATSTTARRTTSRVW